MRIGFIGAGGMAQALARGLISAGIQFESRLPRMQMSKLDEREICYIVVTYLSWSTVEEDKITQKAYSRTPGYKAGNQTLSRKRKEESLPGSLQGRTHISSRSLAA
ncbi:hypothetical protein CEXT_312571 [Caerostris extrusa]|uniref:Pyrroline-5-carboxylate reductase catalytic N-terminal domain-containing protein n=1 Tax=Caerostris extrusa TaxID=172846 RepID=A0AAV4P553_CAEEX|nr:hypothetical protein CEXT_312571 [Caerostris extrusa]